MSETASTVRIRSWQRAKAPRDYELTLATPETCETVGVLARESGRLYAAGDPRRARKLLERAVRVALPSVEWVTLRSLSIRDCERVLEVWLRQVSEAA